jgi:hypothetical protein
MTLKDQLVKYLFENPKEIKDGWYRKGMITDDEKFSYKELGKTKYYLAETCGRELRHAEEESRIATKKIDGQSFYKFLPVERRSKYVPFSLRVNKDELFK